MSIRTYLVIGLVVGGVVYLVSIFFGEGIVDWLLEQQVQAAIRGQRVIDQVVYEPLIFAFNRGVVGAIAAGVAWPALGVWLILLIIALVIVPGLDVVNDIEAVTHLFLS